MYSLMLVDDEPLILNGLYHNIAWEDSGFSSIFKAESAEDALILVRRFRIDVVVTDICMPGMDGIDMCKRILETWPLCKIILLSGYREFSYAQRAVDIGAYQYLVKPVRYEDIQETVSGALDDLKKDLKMNGLLQIATARLKESGFLMRDRLLEGWLVLDRITLSEDIGVMNQAGICVRPGMYGFSLLARWNRRMDTSVRQIALQELAGKLLPQSGEMMFLPLWDGEALITFLADSEESAQSERIQCHNRLDVFQSAVKDSLDIVTTIIIGPVEEATRMGGICERLRTFARNSCAESGSILPYDETFAGAFGLDAVAVAIDQLDPDGVKAWMQGYLAQARAHQDDGQAGQRMSMALFAAISLSAVQHSFPFSELRDIYSSFAKITSHEKAESSVAICASAVERYFDLVRESQNSWRKRLVAQVRAMIEERMEEGITVSGIAEQLHYNPNYLSQLVRQETGMSLEKLLISTRIDHACHLLNEGMQVQGVALRVGYDNLAHFSRLFKQQIGVSPRQYAADCRNEREKG